MDAPRTTSTPLHLLREHLRADSRLRERSISGFVAVAATLTMPFIAGLAPYFGGLLVRVLLGMLGGMVLYEAVLLLLFRRGWFHPAVTWANALLEVSLPAIGLSAVAALRGPEFFVASGLHVLWGALLVVSALRANPRLSVAAGLVAGGEFLALYVWVVVPRLPPSPPLALHLPSILMRSSFLALSGVGGGMVALHFVRKAEDALRSVREQDLMGKYFLHERLGAGGMAEVYRATYCPQGGFQKTVAIKRVLPRLSSNEEFNALFLEEAGLCALLAHPNIVQVFDCGRFQNTFILAMEYVDGASLRRLLEQNGSRLPLSAVTFLGAELAAGLDYLHRRTTPEGHPLNLVHRDVNPPNILVSRLGEVKLADFGVARAATRVKAGARGFFGKTLYAAPEQLHAEWFDGRADLFALGLTLHEALTGEPVLTASAEGLLLEGKLPVLAPPSWRRQDVPPALDALVMQLLSRNPADRPETGAEVRARLMALVGEAAPYPLGQRALAQAVDTVRTQQPAPAVAGDPSTLPDSTPAAPEAPTAELDATRVLRRRG